MNRHRTILSEKEALERIEQSTYLKYVYREIYESFYSYTGNNDSLRVLEIGAGGTSFAEKFWPEIVKTSLTSEGGMAAEKLDFEENSFDLIIAKDVLHHIKNIPQAFYEFRRVLKNNGKILASEPSWSLIGRFVYKFLHEENWEVTDNFIIESSNPWVSNQALIWNLIRLSEEQRRKIINDFNLRVLPSTYGMSYLLSGGVYSQSSISPNLLLNLHKFGRKLPIRFDSVFSMNRIVEMQLLGKDE